MSTAALTDTGAYARPVITDFGSIWENTFAGLGHIVAGGSATLLVHCNSGRGNLSETDTGTHQTNSNTLINPHIPSHGGLGPGDTPTDDCDPGNSGSVNHGGD
jgi:hypothetical protein